MKHFTHFLLLVAGLAQARPLVLLTGYEPFGPAKTNNSWEVAKAVAQRFAGRADVAVQTCRLPTTYAGGFLKLEECYQALPEAPTMVLSLGEGPCEVHLETMMYNLDHNPQGNGNAADNDGVRFTRHTIVDGGPWSVGLRLDVEGLYCSLSKDVRDFVKVSAQPGNFVCNNNAYQFTLKHPDVAFSFAHVSSQACGGEARKRARSIEVIAQVVEAQLTLAAAAPRDSWPHPSNDLRLATSRDEVSAMLGSAQGCERDFLRAWLRDLPAARR